MKINKLSLALVSACLVSSSAFAIDGTINFNGRLVSETCSPVVSGTTTVASGTNATVTLPTVNVSSLSAAGQTTGLTKFTITLTGTNPGDSCVIADAGTATPYFEQESDKVNTNGRLINTGTATNVDIQILNNQQQFIDINQGAADQLASTSTAAGGALAYDYYARYFATAATTAGPVTSSVSYSIVYK